MRILCERYIPPKYVTALESLSWTTVESTAHRFHPETRDATIANHAATNGWVVFTRDRDFFDLARKSDCGLLYLDLRGDPDPMTVVLAIERIAAAYTNHSDVEESIPGDWI